MLTPFRGFREVGWNPDLEGDGTDLWTQRTEVRVRTRGKEREAHWPLGRGSWRRSGLGSVRRSLVENLGRWTVGARNDGQRRRRSGLRSADSRVEYPRSEDRSECRQVRVQGFELGERSFDDWYHAGRVSCS